MKILTDGTIICCGQEIDGFFEDDKGRQVYQCELCGYCKTMEQV